MNIINVGYDSTNYYALEIRGGKLLSAAVGESLGLPYGA